MLREVCRSVNSSRTKIDRKWVTRLNNSAGRLQVSKYVYTDIIVTAMTVSQ